MKTFTGLAIAAVVAAAGAATRAQDGKPDPVLEERIKQQLEDKKRGQEQATKDAADQRAESPETRLARAKLLADSQHDYEKALALAATVTRDTKGAPELRAQALVISARCLNQLGKPDDAQDKLKLAAQLKGPAADEAKRLLDGGLADPQLELRIAKAIEELFSDPADPHLKPAMLATNQTAKDLIWVGAPAVPRLAKVLADIDHLAWVTGAACLLGNIGTPEAAAAIRDALQRSDPLYRRAVMRGFEGMQPKEEHPKFWDGPAREAAVSLMKERDPAIRQAQLVEYADLATVGELLAMTSDPEDKVRTTAWAAIYLRSASRYPQPPDIEAIVPVLRRCLKEDHDPVRLAACNLFQTDSIRKDPDGRELAFESMLDPALTGADLSNLSGWTSAYGALQANQTSLSRPIPVDLLVRVAERFDPNAASDANPRLRSLRTSFQALSVWINNSAGIRIGQSERYGWPATDRAKVWELVRLGYAASCTVWVQANATAEDVPTIVDNCVESGDPNVAFNLVSQRQKTHALNEEQRRSIARSLVRAIDAELVGFDPTDKSRYLRLRQWCLGLNAVGVDFGDEALIRVAEMTTLPDRQTASDLFRREWPPVEARLLPKLVVLSSDSDSSREGLRARNSLLGRMAAVRSPELPKLLAACYQCGLEASTVTLRGDGASRPKGIAWMLTRDVGDDTEAASRLLEERRAVKSKYTGNAMNFAAEWAPSYSEADLRFALEDCAHSGSESFWHDVKSVVDLLPVDGPFDPVATTLLEVSTRLVASAPPFVNRKEPHPVVGVLLSHRAPGWEDLALANVLDARWKDAILRWLPEVTPGLLDRLANVHDPIANSMRRSIVDRLSTEKNPAIRARAPEFLKDEDLSVRQAAISATLAIMPERALDLILPLAKDSSSSVRSWLCTCLGSVFDRRAIPVLVDLLQDPDRDVRAAAKTSLDSLQYAFEQKEKWKRVLEGGGLDSNNAAEALVKQAAAGQPKATRLVAIESLGTLGVAETLPVLIQFMGDGDAEIAAAAKDAVARINRQSKAGKDASDAKSGKDRKPADH